MNPSPPEAAASALEAEMNQLSLEQTLRDFEIANARVLDLTQRVVEANRRIAELQTDLQNLRLEHNRLKAEHDAMRNSQAYRLASRVWAVRNAVSR